MKIIELTGPPGSGKSTICAALKEVMARSGIEVCDASDLVLHSGRYPFDRKVWVRLMSLLPRSLFRKCLRGANNYLYLKHECRMRFVLEHLPLFDELQSRLSSLSIPEHGKRRALELILQTGGRYQMALEAPNPQAVFLQDEGFAHRAISLFVSVDQEVADSTVIEAYVESAPRCQAVIRVEADGAACVRRLRGRRLPRRLAGASESEVQTFVSRAIDVIDTATKVLEQSGIPVFTVRNTEEPFAVAQMTTQLDSFVEAFRGHARHEERDSSAEGAEISMPRAMFSRPLENP